jgi:hypothetical protein
VPGCCTSSGRQLLGSLTGRCVQHVENLTSGNIQSSLAGFGATRNCFASASLQQNARMLL